MPLGSVSRFDEISIRDGMSNRVFKTSEYHFIGQRNTKKGSLIYTVPGPCCSSVLLLAAEGSGSTIMTCHSQHHSPTSECALIACIKRKVHGGKQNPGLVVESSTVDWGVKGSPHNPYKEIVGW